MYREIDLRNGATARNLGPVDSAKSQIAKLTPANIAGTYLLHRLRLST